MRKEPSASQKVHRRRTPKCRIMRHVIPVPRSRGAIKTDRPGRQSTIVTLVNADAPKSVAQFYKDRFTENGLAIRSESLMEIGAMISAQGTGKKTSVTVSREGPESKVVVSFSTS